MHTLYSFVAPLMVAKQDVGLQLRTSFAFGTLFQNLPEAPPVPLRVIVGVILKMKAAVRVCGAA